MAIVIAFVLFLLTFSLGYVLLRARRSAAARRRQAAPEEKKKDADAAGEKEKPRPAGRWGVSKDSYCYPKINDMMDYEFVKVVQVDEKLRPVFKKKEELPPLPGPGEETAETPAGRPRFSAISSEQQSDESGNVIEEVPDEGKTVPAVADPDGEDEYESSIDAETARDLENLGDSFNPWQSKDYDSSYYDQIIEQNLNDFPETIDEPDEVSEEARNMARENENFRELYSDLMKLRSETIDSDAGSDILEQLENMGPESDDDIPEID